MKIPHFDTYHDRDRFLHQLYDNKNYYVFFFGIDYFNKLVEKVHRRWIGPYGNDLYIERTCWEFDNLIGDDNG
jgi:hypothetical protein